MERTIKDLQNITNGMIGRIYYHRCEDNKNYYRTIRLHFNPISNSIQKQISNPVYGEPPDTMPALPPNLFANLQRLTIQDGCSFY